MGHSKKGQQDEDYCEDDYLEYVDDENPGENGGAFDVDEANEAELISNSMIENTFLTGGDNMSIYNALKEDTFRLMKLTGVPENFFSTNTLLDRFTIYKAILDIPEIDPSSADYKFAMQAPLYDLFLYAWKVIRKSFPSSMYENQKSEIEQEFLTRILEELPKYDVTLSAPGPYFSTRIKDSVYQYLNSHKNVFATVDNNHDASALKYMKSFKSRFEQAHYEKLSEGDYILEMHNTFQENNHVSRLRLRHFMDKLNGNTNISIDQIEDFDDTLGGNEELQKNSRDPQHIALENKTREEIALAILNAAENRTDGAAFIRYYYRPDDDEPVTIEEISDMFYDGELSIDQINTKFKNIISSLKEDKEFLLAIGKKLDKHLDADNGFISTADDLSSFVFDDDFFK